MNIFLYKKKYRQQNEKGFTLLEVTFVIGIFAVMASIILFRFKDFGVRTALTNEAQDIAQRIVGAQRGAVSGALTPGLIGTSSVTAPSYGIYFASDSASGTLNRSFTYFADINHDGFFNDLSSCPATATSTNECRAVTTITTGDYISELCYHATSTSPGCITTAAAHVVFKRPLHDALMTLCSSFGTCVSPSLLVPDVLYIEITAAADPSVQKTIEVTALGQVSVLDGPACAPLSICP